MIARTWHGMVPASRGDEYAAYLAKTGIPDYRSTPGNLGVHVLRRTEGDRTHFLLVPAQKIAVMVAAVVVSVALMLAFAGGILGVLMMVPLRRALIVKEHGILPYPEGAACADVLIAGEREKIAA